MYESPLTIALTKGRILKETLPLLEAANIRPIDDVFKSRKLLFETNLPNVRLLILRGSDVTTYVRYGTADMGIAGKDMLMEYGCESAEQCGDQGIYEVLDLNIARCQLMTAGKVDQAPIRDRRIKVATKFINVAKAYYAERGVQADIIKLYGAMELAPIMGLADEIIDIVDTGNTLKANGLVPWDEIADISSRLIVNKASMKMKHADIQNLINCIAKAVG
ncbi:ATP phosphoribosyltransferase [BD1-7 clade bacterium]|uniref:ATP phosphoribosyltransferase n=1 Tax=BD1-7 clade bacterium TaxID=2029982 RepID=A0A5S9N1X3_9GAMM|nr:ATP phosphoribosyltransferase [BD1-7 clade bacterium]